MIDASHHVQTPPKHQERTMFGTSRIQHVRLTNAEVWVVIERKSLVIDFQTRGSRSPVARLVCVPATPEILRSLRPGRSASRMAMLSPSRTTLGTSATLTWSRMGARRLLPSVHHCAESTVLVGQDVLVGPRRQTIIACGQLKRGALDN